MKDLDKYQKKSIVGNPLPSDCRYREDILWLKYGEMELAGKWKVKLEEQQRLDRANRKKFVEGKR